MNVSRSDAKNTDPALMTATPIMSAEAVRAVRRGVRPALSRAKRPAVPNSFWNGAPIVRATGRANVPDSEVTPKIVSSAPTPGERTPRQRAAGTDEDAEQEQADAGEGHDRADQHAAACG